MISLRQSINAKCKECIYDPYAAGAWRMQVAACTSPGCPLFEVRPKSRKVNGCTQKATFQPQDSRSAEKGPQLC